MGASGDCACGVNAACVGATFCEETRAFRKYACCRKCGFFEWAPLGDAAAADARHSSARAASREGDEQQSARGHGWSGSRRESNLRLGGAEAAGDCSRQGMRREHHAIKVQLASLSSVRVSNLSALQIEELESLSNQLGVAAPVTARRSADGSLKKPQLSDRAAIDVPWSSFLRICDAARNGPTHFEVGDLQALPQATLRAAERCRQHYAKLGTSTCESGESGAQKVPLMDLALRERLSNRMCEDLLEYQKDGVRFGISRGGRFLLGDEMGLGKTVQAIAVAWYFREHWPLLVVCPSSVRHTWASELKQWLPQEEFNAKTDAHVVMSGKEAAALDMTAPAAKEASLSERWRRKVVIVSYELAQKLSQDVLRNFRSIIADESHYLKNKDTRRTKFLTPLIASAKVAILLSGTPSLSRPVELYAQLFALDKTLVGSYAAFTSRYCNARRGRFGLEVGGSSNLLELNAILSNSVLLRRLKNDVLNELPPKRRQVIPIKLPAQARAQLKQTMSQLKTSRERGFGDARTELAQFFAKTGAAKVPAVCAYLAELLERNTASDSARSRRDGGTSKASERATHCRPSSSRSSEALDDEPQRDNDGVVKVLVFGHHREVLDSIESFLETTARMQFVRIDGSTPPQRRTGLCERFQREREVRVALLSVTAAGVGITLTAASVVVFAELYWNPGTLVQAEDRAHRIGQRDCVNVKYALAENTLDSYMWALIRKKIAVVSASLDGEFDEQDERFRSQLLGCVEQAMRDASADSPDAGNAREECVGDAAARATKRKAGGSAKIDELFASMTRCPKPRVARADETIDLDAV